MPPKARTKSPVKAATKAPAGSKAVKSANIEAPSKPSAKKSSTGTTKTEKQVHKAPPPQDSPPQPSKINENPKEPMSPEAGVLMLQRTLRAFSARDYLGSRHKRRLRDILNEETEHKLAKRMVFEKIRQKSDRAISENAKVEKERKVKLQDDLCVACFEGEMPAVRKSIDRGANPNGKDENGNYPIGEASVNGQVEVIRYLVKEHDCDPNCKGTYERTPIWRAAFNSHVAAMQALLELGADPRIRAQAQLPDEICNDEAKRILQQWDVTKTDALVLQIQKKRDAIEKLVKAEAEKEVAKFNKACTENKMQWQVSQKQLFHAKCQVEQRILEYDLARDEGKKKELQDVALNCVKEAEALVGKLEGEVEEKLHKYLDSKAQMTSSKQDAGEELPGYEIHIKKLADTVIQDHENLWRNSEKWPFIVDTTDKVNVFLRYRDTNYINVMHPVQMQPLRITALWKAFSH